jgi:hypothetical protein
MKEAGFDVIREVSWDNDLEELAAKFDIENGENDFDSAVEITRHEIGTAEVNMGISGVVKNVDATVFEETIDDTSNGDVITEARNAGAEATDATNEELDGDALLGRLVEGVNNLFIHKGVGFNKNTRGSSCAVVSALAVTELD